ncbi:P protein-like [Bradysia coprophila]|uniref:P protein-like n=1 Tax=Bradysia coprophila TaxID=38358 RepID=UPI00187D98AB|nr:P protein-like [Bradysia coprophila]
MGISRHLKNPSLRRRKDEITPKDVTEQSLQVWLGLPSKIRRDPSLVSFQMEHERLHGHDDERPEENLDEIEAYDNDEDPVEFITMGIPQDTSNNSSFRSHKFSDPPSDIASATKEDVHETIKEADHFFSSSWQNNVKIGILFLVWLFCTGTLVQGEEKMIKYKLISIPEQGVKYFTIPKESIGSLLSLSVEGPLLSEKEKSSSLNYLAVSIESYVLLANSSVADKTSKIWKIPVSSRTVFDTIIPTTRRNVFDVSMLNSDKLQSDDKYSLRIKFQTNSVEEFAIQLGYDMSPINMNVGVIFGGAILILFYGLIIFEVVHRTFAAVMSSILTITILTLLNDRPTMSDVVTYMDMEALLLLFSMMIVVAVMTETGVFDYLAYYAFKISNGKIWPLIHCLCIITILVSSVLDNVTTVLLMTPASIKLCEVMHLNPLPIIMTIILHSNIGGIITPIGDPVSIVITSHQYIAKHGVTFIAFVAHATVGVILVGIQTGIHLRFKYHDIHDLKYRESRKAKELRREITVWKRAADKLSSFSKDVDLVRETLLKKVKILKHQLKRAEQSGTDSKEEYKFTLNELKMSYKIKNKPLLIQSAIALVFVIAFFFIQSVPRWTSLPLSFCALLGVILLLIIADKDDMDVLMHRIEWTTMLFFAAMFVTMECLARLGLINWIGKQSEIIIQSVGEDYRLAVAIIIILWVSALTSSLVDSVAVASMMIRVVVSLAENPSLGLPLQPLVWALAFGASLGGNGTLYGASANVVCAGIAEQHGYKVSFMDYMRVCFPIMIGSIVVATGYLMVSHVVFTWH